MNTDNMIDITGVDLIAFVKGVYGLSRPQGLGFLHFEDGGLSDEEAQNIVRVDDPRMPVHMDYVKGRACKMRVYKEGDKLYIYDSWHDHSPDQLRALLEGLGV